MMRAMFRFLVPIALALSVPAGSQPPPPVVRPVLAAADLRAGTDLDGPWHYSVDPYRDGAAGFHGDAPGAGHRRYDDVDAAQAMRDDPVALYEYDMDSAPVATLPSSWLTHAPEMRYYQGLVWYGRHFTAVPTAGQRQFLRFGAVNYAADVWLNGRKVGHHEGGFTPFALEVTGVLRAGDNRLVVGVDSVASAVTVPPPVTDWENYGGITRSVRLLALPATFVDDAWVRLTRDGRIAADIRLDGPAAAGMAVTAAIPGLSLRLAGRTDASGRWHGEAPAPASLRRWSPDSPVLYDVAVEAGVDRWRDRIGFRTITVRGAQLLLNGRPLFLRGVSLHEEELGRDPGRTVTPAAARALLEEAKLGLHANYVRLAHYPHGEATLRLADELGLLVWSEVPVYWRVAWESPETLARARTILAENILRDRNRAAVAVWSIANETPVTPARTAFLSTLAGDVRRLDPDRLVSAALLTERRQVDGHPVMTVNDPLVDKVDLLAINSYNGWYGDDRLGDLARIGWKVPTDKPLLFSEFGADALAGYHDAAAPKYSEEYQAAYYRATLAALGRIPNLVGLSPWILKDFRSPRRQHPVFQQGWNRKGLISETGVRKQAFAVLADWYAAKAAP
jgi:beta-glucuronidase